MIDLRLRLGLPPYGTEALELDELLTQRAADHEKWINELEASVKEGRKFSLATDPDKCAFGKWYRSFRTDNVVLSSVLKSFDVPHRMIHELAMHVEEKVQAKQTEEAFTMISRARSTTMARLMQLFDRAKESLHDTHREMAVVLDTPQLGRLAISVDEVHSVEPIKAAEVDSGQPKELDQKDPLLGLTMQLSSGQHLATVLELQHLMGT